MIQRRAPLFTAKRDLVVLIVTLNCCLHKQRSLTATPRNYDLLSHGPCSQWSKQLCRSRNRIWKAYKAYAETLDVKHENMLDSLCNLSFALDRQSKYAEAETKFRKAYERRAELSVSTMKTRAGPSII
jgi:tetratricopeptide (TPR) repeat protein